MNAFRKSLMLVLKGAVNSFGTYPAAMASAFLFTIVTMIRIQMDWPVQEAYNFLFDCLHLSLGLGAVFSLAAITAARSRFNDTKSFAAANIIVLIVVAGTFLLLYFFSGKSYPGMVQTVNVSLLAISRVGVAIFVSAWAFILVAGHPKDQSDFARSFFMTHKAFFIALLYGGVMYAGGAGVAGAVQALLYSNMSGKVYMYIGAIAAFLAYAIFIGYFPNFGKGSVDEKREVAQRQPRFIEILFEYIMVPLTLALTVVLLIWSVKTVITGTDIPFVWLSGIAAGYGVIGLWLHIMVTRSESGLAGFYRKVYPFTALVILAFEARALLIQLDKWGLKTGEYWFIIIWIVSVVAALLLIIKKSKAHSAIVIVICGLAVVSVLPVLGYHALPVKAQVDRLEGLLLEEGILADGKLSPGAVEPGKERKEAITDSVSYLAGAEDAKLPPWFDTRLSEGAYFRDTLGFEQTWPDYEAEPGRYEGTYLTLPGGYADISDYQWAVSISEEAGNTPISIDGERGSYLITFNSGYTGKMPSIRIELDGEVTLEQDMKAYFDMIIGKYPVGEVRPYQPLFDDMYLKLESPEVKAMVMFKYVNIYADGLSGKVDYWVEPSMLFMSEK